MKSVRVPARMIAIVNIAAPTKDPMMVFTVIKSSCNPSMMIRTTRSTSAIIMAF
ncbi:MAG: hypothetical protein WCP36_05140 [Methanomicrobiales archaeon]